MADPIERDTLLPSRATPRERAIGGANAAVGDLDHDLIRRAGSPDIAEVPAAYLPARAEARSVDVWDPLWPDAIKRAVIVAAPTVHRHKGTVLAVKAALSALMIDATVTEWWQESPRGEPYTFHVQAFARARLYDGPVLDARLIRVAYAAILRAKPESRAFDFSIGALLASNVGLAPVAVTWSRIAAAASAVVPLPASGAGLGLSPVAAVRPRLPAQVAAVVPVLPRAASLGLAPCAVSRVRIALTALAE